jgi:hypothetical protein
MKYNPLGKTGLNVSRLSFGASALGGVYGNVDEAQGINGSPFGSGLLSGREAPDWHPATEDDRR